MKTHIKFPNYHAAALLLAAGLLLAGCGGGNDEAGPAGADAEPAPGTDVLVASLPDDAPGLVEAIMDAQPGEEILFTGRVGGTMDPITPGFAAFVVADERLVFCDEMGDDDHCPTPWDACCEDPEKIASSRAFVQFVDGAGEPLPVNLAEATGLEANDTVVVRGRLSPDSTPGNPIIVAATMDIQ